MSAKAQVYAWAIVLTVIGLAAIVYKNTKMGVPLFPGELKDTWVIESQIEFDAKGGPVKAKMTLPGYYGNFEVLNQYGSSEGFGFSKDNEGNREMAVWAAREMSGPQKIYYIFSMFDTGNLKDITKHMPDKVEEPFFDDLYKKAIEDIIEDAWKKSADAKTFLVKLLERMKSKEPTQNVILVKKLIKKSYPLEFLVRDMVRFKNINAEVIRGLRVNKSKRKTATEPYLIVHDKQWHLVDLETMQFGTLEDVVFWGPYPLIEVEGGENSKISFSLMKSRESAKAIALKDNQDSALLDFSIYSLPVEHQNVFKLLLLIPFGCLVVVVLRNLVGLTTSGTFMPVLLAMAFIETTLSKGLVVLAVVLTLGLLIRFYLSRLNLLLVPRISAVVISVVMLMAFISVL